MALVPLASKGNFFHVYDFRVQPGKAEEFIRRFDEFDYSDSNPMHKSKAQAKDGVLCRDTEDPDHFYLIGEWTDVEAHRAILKEVAAMRPEFVSWVEGGPANFKPVYAEIVSSTPQDLLDKAAAAE